MQIKLVFIFILFGICNCFSQSKTNVVFNASDEDCIAPLPSLYKPNSDTSHYFLIFESTFLGDHLKVYKNDELIYNDSICTDFSIEIAMIIKIDKSEPINQLSFQINDEAQVMFKPIRNKSYVRIQYLRSNNQIEVCFTKNMFHTE